MINEEAQARWICCPMCDKHKCERQAEDCDVKMYLRNKGGIKNDRERNRKNQSWQRKSRSE